MQVVARVPVESSSALTCIYFCSYRLLCLKQRPLLSTQLDDCTLQLSHNGTYLDMESSLAEQRDELEGFQHDDTG